MSTASAMDCARSRQRGSGQPIRRARSKRRSRSSTRSRQSENARSRRNNSGPVRAARSRRSARKVMSKSSGTARACAMRRGTRQEGNEQPRGLCARLRPVGARFRASAALRGLRHDRRGRPQLLRGLLEAGRVPGRERLYLLRTAVAGDRADDLRAVPRGSAADRKDARCRRL